MKKRLLVVIVALLLTSLAGSSGNVPAAASCKSNTKACTCNYFEIKENAGGCPEITDGEKPNLIIYEAYSQFSCSASDQCLDTVTGKTVPCRSCPNGYGDTGKGDVSAGAAGTDCTAAKTVEEFTNQ